jgi:hypothetical protein
MAEPGAIVSTTLLDVLIFSGDKETREYNGRSCGPTQRDGKEESSKSSMKQQGHHRTLPQELQERRSGVVGRGRTVRQASEDAEGDYDKLEGV